MDKTRYTKLDLPLPKRSRKKKTKATCLAICFIGISCIVAITLLAIQLFPLHSSTIFLHTTQSHPTVENSTSVIDSSLVVTTEDSAAENEGKTFTAGVYEQKLVGFKNARTRQEALVAINSNLIHLGRQAENAKHQGVDVLVFAEYGITGFMGHQWKQRHSVYPYVEQIPAASITSPVCVSCNGTYQPGKEGQTAIGCMAKKHQIYIVANLIEAVNCSQKDDKSCPDDGHYQYNTNIIYNRKGCLIAKYHKYYLFDEEVQRLDKPKQPENVYFDTEFGRFGTIICEDAVFKTPGITLVEKYKIDHMLFPTAWNNANDASYMMAVEWQLAYAARMNINFIAANVHMVKGQEFGSGIYSGQQVVNFTADPSTHKGLLLTGVLPVKVPKRKTLDFFAGMELKYKSTQSRTGTVSVYNDTYKAVALKGLSGDVDICDKSLCCSLKYKRNSIKETYVLAAYKGNHHFEEKMAVENCVVIKCKNADFKSCSERITSSETVFPVFNLESTFSVDYVFPTLLPSEFKYNNIKWSFTQGSNGNSTILQSSSEWPLVVGALIGRDFKHDLE